MCYFEFYFQYSTFYSHIFSLFSTYFIDFNKINKLFFTLAPSTIFSIMEIDNLMILRREPLFLILF